MVTDLHQGEPALIETTCQLELLRRGPLIPASYSTPLEDLRHCLPMDRELVSQFVDSRTRQIAGNQLNDLGLTESAVNLFGSPGSWCPARGNQFKQLLELFQVRGLFGVPA
jgi:hypothetical protein